MLGVDVLVERLNSLKTYQVYVELPTDKGVFLKRHVASSSLFVYSFPLLDQESERKIHLQTIKFPDQLCPTNEEFQYTTISNQYIQCKLLYEPKEEVSLYESDRKLPLVESFKNVVCKSCSHPILDLEPLPPLTRPLKKVLALPSEYWLEISELWVCHNPDNFKHFPREPITAKEGHCLVSSTYIMMPGNMIFQNSLIPSYKVFNDNSMTDLVSKKEYIPIVCSGCKNFIGLSNEDYLIRNNKKDQLITYKLYKYALKDLESNLFQYNSIENKLADDIYALVKTRGCYRVYVFGFSSTFYLQLQVLSWNTHIIDTDTFQSKPIIKILFKTIHADMKPEEQLEFMRKHGNKIEELVIVDEECKKLETLLKTNCRVFPEKIRNAFPNDMTLSFLHFYDEPQ